jgi:hypothetical protein
MLDDIKFLFDLIDRFYKKKTETKEKQNFDKVLTAIYTLGNNGNNSVNLEALQRDAGLKKLDVLNAIEAAKEKNGLSMQEVRKTHMHGS